jgi:transposase
MMTQNEELTKLRTEARKLRQENATLIRSRNSHEERIGSLEKGLKKRNSTIKKLQEEKHALTQEVTTLKNLLSIAYEKAKKYAGMVFKANTVKKKSKTGRERGGVKGHKGVSRTKPERIDKEVDVSLTHCYHCSTPLSPTTSYDERIVEDIPTITTTITKYRIQRQWCTTCHKEVRGVPRGTLPGVRIGIGVLSLILILKYRSRTPLERISEILKSHYGLTLTSQGIQKILTTVSTRFKAQYNQILTEIRHAPVKHADETSWRIEGINSWCWLFATPSVALYTIEETRGKGVPEEFLGASAHGVLVRDDYAGYKNLPLDQQSCWAHLLRVSHEWVEKEDVSESMKVLHNELSVLYQELVVLIATPFEIKGRKALYATYLARIDALCTPLSSETDTRAVQTRLVNQRGNLITALLHENTPLTNNFAERMIRPIVITRKISGGSQSRKGAMTHAVNMSIMQTLSLKGEEFREGITALLHGSSKRYGGV